jgi:hypothetical protein
MGVIIMDVKLKLIDEIIGLDSHSQRSILSKMTVSELEVLKDSLSSKNKDSNENEDLDENNDTHSGIPFH